MLTSYANRQNVKREALGPRDRRALRSVACSIMGVAYGPVEVKADETAEGYAPEGHLKVSKSVGGCLAVTSVPVRWEMTDNRSAIAQSAPL